MKNTQQILNINYQEGSIVSKEIINKSHTTITLFAFDKGQGLSEHSSPYEALLTILEGRAVVILEGKELKLKVGESILMKENQIHSIQALEPFKMLLVIIK